MPGRTREVQHHSSARARGFSFVEILFAMAVLGIGFILIAAIFPAGLLQTKLTLDETAGAAGSRAMSARLQQVAQSVVQYAAPAGATTSTLPCTYEQYGVAATAGQHYRGQVRTLNDPRDFADANDVGLGGVRLTTAQATLRRFNAWQSMANDLINPATPRNASVVLFRRDAYAPATGVAAYKADATAQVIVVNTQVSNQPQYVANDVSVPQKILPAKTMYGQAIYDLEARPVAVQIVYDPGQGNYVATFFSVRHLDGGAGTAIAAARNRGGYPTGNAPKADLTSGTIAWDDVLDAALNTVDTGCFVVISDDRIQPPATGSNVPSKVGQYNGRSFRLGNRRPDLEFRKAATDPVVRSFDLAPGYDFKPEAGNDGKLNAGAAAAVHSTDDLTAIGVDDSANTDLRSGITYASGASVMVPKGGNNTPDGTDVHVYGTPEVQGAVALVVGRGFSDSRLTPPGVTTTGGVVSSYAGPVQDVSLYTTFVTIPNQ